MKNTTLESIYKRRRLRKIQAVFFIAIAQAWLILVYWIWLMPKCPSCICPTYTCDIVSCELDKAEAYANGQKNAKECYKVLKSTYMAPDQYIRFLNKDYPR